MARLATIKFLRATRAVLTAKAAASEVLQGEPYLITDEDRLAVGVSTGGIRAVANELDLPNPFFIATVVSNEVSLAPLKNRSGAVLVSSASPVTINNFTGGVEGQEIVVYNTGAGDVTVNRNNAYLAGAANQVIANRNSIRLLKVGSFWYQTGPLMSVG
jgi:hypothetical protein